MSDRLNLPRDTVVVEIPRSALQIIERPHAVSQHTSERVLGLPRAHYLEAVRDFAAAGGHVIHVGRLRVVEVEPFMSWLRDRERLCRPVAPVDPVAELAAELGLARVAR